MFVTIHQSDDIQKYQKLKQQKQEKEFSAVMILNSCLWNWWHQINGLQELEKNQPTQPTYNKQ